MFDILKKKIQSFAQKIVGASAAQPSAPVAEAVSQPVEEKSPEMVEQSPSSAAEPVEESVAVETPKPVVEIKKEIQTIHPAPVELPQIKQEEARELKAKTGIAQQITGFFTGAITLKEETISDFLEEFELSLLEADVNVNTATALIEKLRSRLSGKTAPRGKNLTQFILEEIKSALHEIVSVPTLDFDEEINKNHPCVILILGPNGAGKTTSIAKLTHYLQQRGKKVTLASADTFRAGSIEQLQVHADKLGVRLIKHQYGSDPAAVAFDAVKAARAENGDVVIIDTAGRQDTNKNLLEELKKINRVIQPNLKLYVGESFTGQAILTQARTFDEAIGIDGFILTKLDTDAKGGGVISILHELHKPIVFFGVGQAYPDLAKFDLDSFLERIIPTQK